MAFRRAPPPDAPSSLRARLALACASLVLSALLADRALGWLGVDWRLVERRLHYDHADLPLYRASDDPVLHFVLSPGARYELRAGPRAYAASVDPWGARGPAHPAEKPPGTTRILYLGASTVFGAGVDDGQALPARLEQRLPEAGSAPVEVWNFGHSSYVGAQVGRLARAKIAEVPGVNVLLLTLTNDFPRPFLPPWPVRDPGDRRRALAPAGPPVDNRHFFTQDPSHWPENFPDPPLGGLLGAQAVHGWLLTRSPAWRCLCALGPAREGPAPPNATTRALRARELGALEAEARARGIALCWVPHPALGTAGEPGSQAPVLPLRRGGEDPSWDEIHPPPDVLDAWARHLAALLLERGLVPRAGQAPG